MCGCATMRFLFHNHNQRLPDCARSRGVRRSRFWMREQAQSLIEVALIAPLLIFTLFYAFDFGYFFFVAASLSSSSRTAAEYSIQGLDSVSQTALPSGGPISSTASVSGLAVGDLPSLLNSTTTTSVEVCLSSVTNSTASCTMYGPSATLDKTDLDPEGFPLNRVDVTYTINPPIPLSAIGNFGLPTRFHRIVEMRAIN